MTPRPEREGAALLIVMVILLMVTATATFAIHSTAAEVRASGHARMAMQSNYVGESALAGALDWVDRNGPQVLIDVLDQRASMTPLVLAPFEPELFPGKVAHRLYRTDLSLGVSESAETEHSVDVSVVPLRAFGARNVYESLYLVDVYDHHVYTGTMPGFSAGGGATMRHVRATYTARGRARIAGAVLDANSPMGALHESAGDARAQAISGPFAAR